LSNTRFLGSVIDLDFRMLILFTNATSGNDDSNHWIQHTMVVHTFVNRSSGTISNTWTIVALVFMFRLIEVSVVFSVNYFMLAVSACHIFRSSNRYF
jgi:hypothetical protein